MAGDRSFQVQETITVTESVSITKRSYYSISWLTTADIMKDHAEAIGSGDDRPDPPDYDQMRAFVLSAVTAAGAFLEAHINELFDDSDKYLQAEAVATEALRGLDRETQVRLAALWPHSKKYRVLEKYDIALDLAEADSLPRGVDPAQSAADLLRVRNHYLHYKPESATDGVAEGDDRKLSERMKGKLNLPAWDRDGEDLFPTRAIGPDLARWAVESAVRYADAFCERLGIAPGYDHVRPDWLGE